MAVSATERVQQSNVHGNQAHHANKAQHTTITNSIHTVANKHAAPKKAPGKRNYYSENIKAALKDGSLVHDKGKSFKIFGHKFTFFEGYDYYPHKGETCGDIRTKFGLPAGYVTNHIEQDYGGDRDSYNATEQLPYGLPLDVDFVKNRLNGH